LGVHTRFYGSTHLPTVSAASSWLMKSQYWKEEYPHCAGSRMPRSSWTPSSPVRHKPTTCDRLSAITSPLRSQSPRCLVSDTGLSLKLWSSHHELWSFVRAHSSLGGGISLLPLNTSKSLWLNSIQFILYRPKSLSKTFP